MSRLAQLLEFSTALSVLATLALMMTPPRARRHASVDAVATALVLAGAAGATGVISRDLLGACMLPVVGMALVIAIRAVASDWELLGCTLFGGVLSSALSYLGYVGLITFGGSLSPVAVVISTLLLVLEIAALALTATYVHELVDVLARRRWHGTALPGRTTGRLPRVCIQVPAYNEPVELLKETLNALALLDYPNYMVQLVDNNTTDPALWEPVRAHCRKLGRRFHFIHLENWPGYKSGALNEATRRLPKDVEIVAVVDADYVVEPTFLAETVGHFSDPEVAFVQTPQHYQKWADNAYLSACYYAYKYFFDVTMPSRQQRNAIIFGGTMGLIRRSVLDLIGGWDEWCITEDAESSLRILAEGYRGVFVSKAYGHGLMPLSFDGLKKQRFRWAFGGIQILKKHWRLILTGKRPDGSRSNLTFGQRYHYLVGALQWFNELLTVAFTILLLVSGSVLLLGHHLPMRQLTGAVLAIPLLFILTGLLRLVWALRVRSGATTAQALGALGVLFSLSWVVSQACVLGLIRKKGVFLRTPKARSSSGIVRSVTATRVESAFAAAALGLSAAILGLRPGPIALGLGLLTLLQGAIYLNSPINALRAEGIRLTPLRRIFNRSPQNTGQRPEMTARRARNALIAAGLAFAASTFVAAIATAPEGAALVSPGSLLPQVGAVVGRAANALGVPATSTTPTPGSLGSSPGNRSQVGGGATPRPGPSVGGAPVVVGGGTSPTPNPGSTPTSAPSSNPGNAPTSAPTSGPTSPPTSRPTGAPTSPTVSHPTPSPHHT